MDPEDVESNAANQVLDIFASDDSSQVVTTPFALQCASSTSHRDPANQVHHTSASDGSNPPTRERREFAMRANRFIHEHGAAAWRLHNRPSDAADPTSASGTAASPGAEIVASPCVSPPACSFWCLNVPWVFMIQ